VHVEPQAFLAYALARVTPGKDVRHALETAHVADLYLACACALGNGAAIALFEATYTAEIERALSFARVDAGRRDDVVSRMREQLFFPRPSGAPALISTYSGRGKLRSWAQSVALHEAVRLARPAHHAEVIDELALHLAETGTDPEMAYMKSFYLEEFRSALGRALRALPRRDRVLLRQHYLDEMSLEAMATAYRVHRATAARRLADARDRVLARTKEELVAALHLAPSELESVLKFVREQSSVEASIGAALAASSRPSSSGGVRD
jgi:RNA polymerase sigma-70 factor (ECF subfamily)